MQENYIGRLSSDPPLVDNIHFSTTLLLSREHKLLDHRPSESYASQPNKKQHFCKYKADSFHLAIEFGRFLHYLVTIEIQGFQKQMGYRTQIIAFHPDRYLL